MKKIIKPIFYPPFIPKDTVYVYVNQKVYKPDGSINPIDYSMRNALRDIKDLAYKVKDEVNSGNAQHCFVPVPKDEGELIGLFLPERASGFSCVRAINKSIKLLLEHNQKHPDNTYHIPLPMRWNKHISDEEVRELMSKLPDNFNLYL